MQDEPRELLHRTILGKLTTDPGVDASRIAVAVDDSQITLTGTVRCYFERCHAETLVRSVSGVAGVQNEIDVRLSIGHYRTDAGLAHLTNELLENHAALALAAARAHVQDGWVTLRGTVPSDFHKRTAESAIGELCGVRGITNRLRVTRVQ
jgi:osmotically-inducible protein OsmY